MRPSGFLVRLWASELLGSFWFYPALGFIWFVLFGKHNSGVFFSNCENKIHFAFKIKGKECKK